MANDENKIILEFPATNVEIEFGETITFDNISGFLNSDRVTYNGDSLTEEITDLEDSITDLEDSKADTTYVDTELGKKADKSNTYTKSEVDTLIDNLPEPMIFKGTLGVGGTIQTLPAASASNEGWTYKVITDGTYAGQTAKVGDVFTSNGSAWVLIPSGDEDNDTWRAIKVEGVEVLGNGISSGAVDFVGSENIEVDFDGNGNKVGVKTKNIYTKEEVDDIVYNILPDDTASGSIANFETDLALPIKSLEIDINAKQASGTPTPATPLLISGWDSVKVAQTSGGSSALLNALKGLILGTYSFVLVDGVNKTVSSWGQSNPNGYPVYTNINGMVNRGITSQANGFNTNASSVSSAALYSCGCGSGSPNTYSFILPNTVTSATEANLWFKDHPTIVIYELATPVTPTITPEQFTTLCIAFGINGTEVIIPLGQTVYGGHFTQDKAGHRQFEVTSKYVTYTGAENESWTFYNVAQGNLFRITARDRKDGYITPTNCMCNSYKPVQQAQRTNGTISGTSIVLDFINNDISNLADWKLNLANNPIQVVYELAEPIIIDLPDGEPIITFNGTNNIYADTGDTSVVFKDSVNGYVEKKIASVQALALNT